MAIKYPADGLLRAEWLVDAAGTAIADVDSPSLAALATAEDLSCDIQSGGVDMGISTGTIDAASICSALVAMSLGRVTVSPTFTFWRYKPPDDTAWELFEYGSQGWIILRSGVASADALAVGDSVTVAYLAMSEPVPAYPGGDTNATFSGSMVLLDGQKFNQKAVLVA